MFYFLTALEIIPIALFFLFIKFANIFVATAVLMFSTIVCLGAKYCFTKKASYFLIFSCLLLLIMGTLTIIFKNPSFIKMKPTIMYSAYGATLYFGAQKGKIFIKNIFTGFAMQDAAWKTLSHGLAYFCFCLAAVNEVVWRLFSENTWVNYKVFIMPLIIAVAFLAVKNFIDKHKLHGTT